MLFLIAVNIALLHCGLWFAAQKIAKALTECQ